MSFSINTNLLTLNAQSALRSNQSLQSKTMERLSTGVRVNGAEDDAAGLAIGNRMTSQIRGLDQAVRNIHDGISLIETADGGLNSIEKILQRMRELAIQSSNGTYTESDRAALNSESILLQQAISQVVSSTQFNNQTLLDGTFYDKRIQLGANRDQQIELDIPSMSLTDIGAVNTSITQITHVTLSTPPNPSPLITQNPNYIEYTNLGTPEETLSVTKSLSPNVANDAISIVGTNVYRGNGVAAVQIGTLDSQLDGTGGKALRINLEQQFSNGSFDTGVAGSSSIQGWTAINQRVWLDGSSTLAGWPTPIDATTAPGGGIESASGSGTFTSILSADTVANSGLSVQLTSNLNGVTNNPSGVGGVLHGPALYSDSSIFLNQGDTISFEWKASGGSDAFDVYAYILDTQSGHTEKLLDSTGLSRFVTQPWTEVSHTINTSGDYKFVFVSGTWDETAGQAAGANLYIDNVRANSSTPPLMSNGDVSKLTELVIYQNSAEINASISID